MVLVSSTMGYHMISLPPGKPLYQEPGPLVRSMVLVKLEPLGLPAIVLVLSWYPAQRDLIRSVGGSGCFDRRFVGPGAVLRPKMQSNPSKQKHCPSKTTPRPHTLDGQVWLPRDPSIHPTSITRTGRRPGCSQPCGRAEPLLASHGPLVWPDA